MPKKPYPGENPSVELILEKGGYSRSCFVVDVLSYKSLDNSQKAVIEEHLQAYIDKLVDLMPSIKEAEVINPDRFDPILLKGLRIK
jgi:hypothetical protein